MSTKIDEALKKEAVSKWSQVAFRHRFLYRTVCGDVRSGALLGHRDRQLHVSAYGKRSRHQRSSCHIRSPGHVHAV